MKKKIGVGLHDKRVEWKKIQPQIINLKKIQPQIINLKKIQPKIIK